MKRLAGALVLSVVVIAVVAGCGSSGGSSSSSESSGAAEGNASGDTSTASSGAGAEGMKIGISSLSQSLPFVAAIVEGAENKAKAEGAEVVLTDAQGKSEKQTSDIQDLLSQEPSGIVMIPVDSEVAQGQVNMIASHGIPVVSAGVEVGDPLKRPLKEVYPQLTALVTQNEPEVGEQAAELVEKELPEGGEIAIISGAPGFAEDTTRVVDFEKKLEASGSEYDVVANQPGGWTPQEGQSACANLLTANPGIKLFYNLSDDMAVGCANAIKSAGSEAKIIGVGGYKETIDPIKAGNSPIVGTVCFQPVEMGEVAVEKLIEKINGADIQAQFFSYPTFGVTKENVSKCVPQV